MGRGVCVCVYECVLVCVWVGGWGGGEGGGGAVIFSNKAEDM